MDRVMGAGCIAFKAYLQAAVRWDLGAVLFVQLWHALVVNVQRCVAGAPLRGKEDELPEEGRSILRLRRLRAYLSCRTSVRVHQAASADLSFVRRDAAVFPIGKSQGEDPGFAAHLFWTGEHSR